MGNLGTLFGSRANGEEFPVEVSISKVSVSDEIVYTAIVRDISERKRIENQHEQAAIDAERNRLARELHDSVTQALFSATLFAQAGNKGIQSGNIDGAAHYFNRILETSHQALKEMRLFIYDLLPEQLTLLGLVEAIQQRIDTVEKRTGIQVDYQYNDLGHIPDSINEALYRITQEALNNSLKHANADNLTIRIDRNEQQITLEISDDGQGFELEEVKGKGGIGLLSMQERTEQLNGKFMLESMPQQGTSVSVVLEMRP
jgi:signal transduction histidine kinase